MSDPESGFTVLPSQSALAITQRVTNVAVGYLTRNTVGEPISAFGRGKWETFRKTLCVCNDLGKNRNRKEKTPQKIMT